MHPEVRNTFGLIKLNCGDWYLCFSNKTDMFEMLCTWTRPITQPHKMEVPMVLSEKLSRSSGGGRLFLLVWIFLVALCVALSLSMGSFARDAEAITKTFSGKSITNSDPTQTGRLGRRGEASTCTSQKPFPGLLDPTPHHYDSYALKNGKKKSCVTVTLTTPCESGHFLQSAAYRPSFNPANIARNYVADIGASPNGAPKSYSFIVPKNATFNVVVNEVDAGTGCSSYTLKVSGLSKR